MHFCQFGLSLLLALFRLPVRMLRSSLVKRTAFIPLS